MQDRPGSRGKKKCGLPVYTGPGLGLALGLGLGLGEGVEIETGT